MRLKEYHHDQEGGSDMHESPSKMSEYGIKSQKINNLFTPNVGRNKQLDEFCTSISNETDAIPHRASYMNISRGERNALINLSKTINENIVIKTADKGGALVVQDKADYIQVCNNLLSNPNFYRTLENDPTPLIHSKLSNLLAKLIKTYHLGSELTASDLINRFPSPGRFYTLPKIHKSGTPPPGRPIVSGNGTVTEVASNFIDYFLKPLVPTLSSYIQDTTHFLRLIQEYNFPPNSIIGTLDVESLYTNIPHGEGLESCEFHLNKRDNQKIPTNFLVKLMDFVLKNNNFTFNNTHYVQVQGTAMGTPMAPSYACLFMGVLEQKILDKALLKPDLWIRFIDDIFFVWTHGQEKWLEFYQFINSFHQSIKLTYSISEISIPFLDVEVKIVKEKIETDLYTKPTDCHNYLPWSSCHPLNTKIGIPYSQALRLRRICSNDKTFFQRLYELEGYLRKCGYPSKHVRPAFNAVKSIPRIETLNYKDHETNNRITFPITYHPNFRNLHKIVFDKYNNILLKDPNNSKIFKEPPMMAYRRPKNLRDQLTRASLTGPTRRGGFLNCTDSDCMIHNYTTPSNTFRSTVTGVTYPISRPLTCADNNVIYLVTCTKPDCRQQYTGETGRTFKDRTNEHIKSVDRSKDCPIKLHFCSPGHTLEHFTTQIIEKCHRSDTAYRRTRENYWRDLLKTDINKQHSLLHQSSNTGCIAFLKYLSFHMCQS